MTQSHLAAPGGEEAASLTPDQRYWLDRRAEIIGALRAEGLEIWSDKDRVWVHHMTKRTDMLDALKIARTAFASIANGIPDPERYAHKCALAMDDVIRAANPEGTA